MPFDFDRGSGEILEVASINSSPDDVGNAQDGKAGAPWFAATGCAILHERLDLAYGNYQPMLWHGASFRLLEQHMGCLGERDGTVGEVVVEEALLELARGGQHLLARLLRPLHRPQHRRNGPLLGERR